MLTGAKISNVKAAKDSVSMTVEAGGEKKELKADIVLVAAGRAPNVEDIGLKEAGVQLTERGFIKINERMETTAKGIYAIGDVAGPPMLAHKGEREGVVLAELLAGKTHARNGLRQHSERDVLPPRSRVGRAHRAAVQGQEARLQSRKVPLLGERPRAHVGRDRGLREDHSRREVRRDPRRAHRRRARDGADSRARRGARRTSSRSRKSTWRSTRIRRCPRRSPRRASIRWAR